MEDTIRQLNKDIFKLRVKMVMTELRFRMALAINSFKIFLYS